MSKTSLFTAACAAFVFSAGVMLATQQASAAATATQDCATQWKAMKTANKVPAGMKWSDFEKTCKANAAKPAAAAPVVPAKPAAAATAAPAAPAAAATAKPAATAAKPVATAPVVDGKAMEKARIKQCGTEWKAMKAANKVPAGLTWPKFWSDCNAKLKAAGK